MRKIIFSLLLCLPSFAIQLDIQWTESFTKEIHLNCGFIGCLDGYSNDIIEEEVCDECFSDSINATFIFKYITTYLHVGERISEEEFLNYLYQREYISINYQTPYDIVSSRSTAIKRILYKELCPNDDDPIIFFRRSYDDIYSFPEVIYCGEEVYEAVLF